MQTARQHRWSELLDLFSRRAAGKPTRLGVFVEEERGYQDLWVEDGLPLAGISVDTDSGDTDVELMFKGREDSVGDHYTHSVRRVREVAVRMASDPLDDTLEIVDQDGKRTLLRFEKLLANTY